MRVATFLLRTKVRDAPGFGGKVLKFAEVKDRAFGYHNETILANGLPWNLLYHKDGIEGWSATTDGTDQLCVIETLNPRFLEAVAFTLEHEGGYVWNEADPGGETHWGISKRSYPELDIKNLTKEQAKLIYYVDYWLPLACYNLPWPQALFVFDLAVLTGVGHIAVWRDLAPGVLMSKHLHYLCNISTFSQFGKGWTRRAADLLAILT